MAREARAARSEARCKALEALRHAQLAAKLDAQANNLRLVLKHYELALSDFGQALQGDAIPESRKAKTLAAMSAYLDRCRQLRLDLERPDAAADAADGASRRAVLVAMARAGAAVLARGVAAKKAALAADSDWARFVHLSEAADSLVAYLKASADPPEAVTRAATASLGELEALVARLKNTSG